MLDEQTYASAFVASPYHWPVIGWMKDLDRITRDDMVEYFRVHYAPDNCILVLTGDFDTRTALDRIRHFFGPIPKQPPPAEPVNSEPEQRGERRADVHYPAQNVSFEMGYKAPAVTSDDLPALDVLSSILSEGESSRLHQSLVYEKQIALSVSASFHTNIDPSLFEVYVEMRPGKTGAEGEAAVDSVLADMVKSGPTDRELTKAKNLLEANFVRGLKTNNGTGNEIAYYEAIFGDYRAMFKTIDRYRAVTAADCKRAAKACFDNLERTVVTLVPEPESEAAK
jgi:predicted Zn-dependent peptidase